MRPPRTYSIAGLLIMLVVLAASCNRPTNVSSVLRGGSFDPAAAFRQRGYTIQTEVSGEGVSNAEYGYAWTSWCGVIGAVPDRKNSSALAVIIRNGLNKAPGGTSRDELTEERISEGEPLRGMLAYSKDMVRGEMHVWLTPCASNTVISHVIFVREERLK